MLIQDKEKTSYLVKAYILNNITLDGYDKENTVQNLWNIFTSEMGYNIPRVGEKIAFISWLEGMPSAFDIKVYYYEVNQILQNTFEVEVSEDDVLNFQVYLGLIYNNIKELL